MLDQLEEMNDKVWGGHSSLFEDATHALGGMGFGLLACSFLGRSRLPIGYGLVAFSAFLHVYAMLTAPQRQRRSVLAGIFGEH